MKNKLLSKKYAVLLVALITAASQAQTTVRTSSAGIQPWTGTVLLKVPQDLPVGGSGTMCGVLAYADSGIVGNQPCEGIALNAPWPYPRCPAKYQRIQISGASGGGGFFGGASNGESYSCMIQPAGGVWAQNDTWETYSSVREDCDSGSKDKIYQRHLVLLSNGSIFADGQTIYFEVSYGCTNFGSN